MYFYDPTYILVLIGMVLSILASRHVQSVYEKYARVRSRLGMTGREAAERILRQNGIYDVQVHHIPGALTDHYDPRNKTLGLSDSTYQSESVAAIGVAAHECGHAIQHARGYVPLHVRGILVPVARFGSTISWPLIVLGFCLRGDLSLILLQAGIVLFLGVVIFQLVTLPVELNASANAIRALESSSMMRQDEVGDVKRVLRAAALTYVAATAASALQLLRLLMIANGRRRR